MPSPSLSGRQAGLACRDSAAAVAVVVDGRPAMSFVLHRKRSYDDFGILGDLDRGQSGTLVHLLVLPVSFKVLLFFSFTTFRHVI